MDKTKETRELNPTPGREPTWPALVEPAWEYVKGGYKDHGHVIPSIAGLASVLGTTRKSIHEWANNVDSFRNIVDKLLQDQEQVLLSNGLAGTFNSSITKLILTKHGYSDKQETALTGPDGGPVQVQEIQRKVVDPKH